MIKVNGLQLFEYNLTLFILMDIPRHVDRIRKKLSILYFMGSQVELSKL